MATKSAGTPALDILTGAGITFSVHEYDHEARHHFGDETVAVLGVSAERVFKTLIASVSTSGKPELVVGIVPVSGQMDLKALAATVGAKRAEMADPAVAQRSSGYVVGGISPLGQRTRLRTVIDQSAMTYETMLVSGGRRGLQVELTPADLVRLTDGTVAEIGRP